MPGHPCRPKERGAAASRVSVLIASLRLTDTTRSTANPTKITRPIPGPSVRSASPASTARMMPVANSAEMWAAAIRRGRSRRGADVGSRQRVRQYAKPTARSEPVPPLPRSRLELSTADGTAADAVVDPGLRKATLPRGQGTANTIWRTGQRSRWPGRQLKRLGSVGTRELGFPVQRG